MERGREGREERKDGREAAREMRKREREREAGKWRARDRRSKGLTRERREGVGSERRGPREQAMRQKRDRRENTQTVHQLTAGWGIESANTMKQSVDRLAAE